MSNDTETYLNLLRNVRYTAESINIGELSSTEKAAICFLGDYAMQEIKKLRKALVK